MASSLTADAEDELRSFLAADLPTPTSRRAATSALCALLAEPLAYDYTRRLLTSEADAVAQELNEIAGQQSPTRWPPEGAAFCSVRQARDLYQPALARRVQFLLQASADPNGMVLGESQADWDCPPQSPLMCCAIHGWQTVAQLLLHAQAAPSQADVSGGTALHYAATHGEEELYNLLLKAAADPNRKDTYGRCAWELLETAGVALNFLQTRRQPAQLQEAGLQIVRMRVDSLLPARFVSDFVALKRPVLLKTDRAGSQSPIDNCGADGRSIPWSCEDLSNRAGDARAMVSAIPYGSDFGLDASLETPLTLRQFLAAPSVPAAPAVKRQRRDGAQVVNAAPPYFFVAVDQELQPELAEALETSLGLSAGSQLPWPLGAVQTGQKLPFRATTLQFAVGAEGSGSPMHFHQDALNLCLHGRKRWWLVPPSEAAFSRCHPLDALEMGMSAKDVKDCFEGACVFEQEEGDIVYVPDMWGHAVMNLEDHTVCVAAEFA